MIGDIVDKDGYTLLHMMCFRNQVEMSKRFLDKLQYIMGSDELNKYVNKKTTKEGFTALHFACYKGCLEMVKALVNAGADWRVKNNFGINMLHVSA